MVIWRMIRWFFYYLWDYDGMMDFMEHRPDVKEESIKCGEYAEWYSSRWRYAWKMTRVQWKHLDCLKHC